MAEKVNDIYPDDQVTLDSPVVYHDADVTPDLPKEPTFTEGYKQGFMGRPGTGVGHFLGEATLPTAGAVIGAFGGPGGSIAGAAAGESAKEAIGAGYETAQGLPQSTSDTSKVLSPVVAAVGQAVGERYMAPAFGKAWDAAGWVGKKISEGLAWTSKIPQSSMEFLRSNASEMLDKVGTVNKEDLRLAGEQLITAVKNAAGPEAEKTEVLNSIRGVIADKDPLTKMDAMVKTPAFSAFHMGRPGDAVNTLTDPAVTGALNNFFTKSTILGLSGPIIEAAPADELGRHLLQYSAAGALGHALGTTIPAIGVGVAVTNPAIVRTSVGITNMLAGAAERGVAKAAASAAAPAIKAAAAQAATQALPKKE